jgi:hypothetical protein
MADASRTNNLPALWSQIEGFLDSETLFNLKVGFVRILKNSSYEEIVQNKKRFRPRDEPSQQQDRPSAC